MSLWKTEHLCRICHTLCNPPCNLSSDACPLMPYSFIVFHFQGRQLYILVEVFKWICTPSNSNCFLPSSPFSKLYSHGNFATTVCRHCNLLILVFCNLRFEFLQLIYSTQSGQSHLKGCPHCIYIYL